ncbi:bifunctional diguanylate cyclase/phosphodiesterase [Sphaerotilus uruguayifluvii]|uniref:EAL domain-containing protein (Putative c-di-GMP-specific phosphodiesterase class I)/GGDEF domain-containing protein n=1 Tax=Sphaerotilus uruguayifluvii TaxID=2735897 RepID=A0ABX2G3Y3_9BURK|nr:EAL domain-containing protein [Leptothrix sp. C29]NRT55987.1 EAL domain-containing protein (putative c-di-GMP-specific phosphodiesterase class I)/GGDEF domain-containing protein [Leptothrix sp. C29]
MSLIRQVWILIMGTIVLAGAGSVAMSIWSVRGSIEAQLSMKNNDNAQTLALSMSQQRGDRALLELAIASQFDTGYYESIRLLSPTGQALVSRRAPQALPQGVPAWFVGLVPVHPRAGVAQVSSGWNQVGTLEMRSQASFAYADLWWSSVRMTLWALGVGVLAALLGHLAVRRLRRQLDAVVDQAEALTQRRFVSVVEPSTPELRRVAQAMNMMVGRLNQFFSEQAQQVDQLRRQASCDPLTGLAHRGHFMALLASFLGRDDGVEATQIVLVRVLELAEVNRRLGHLRTDEMLRSIAAVLSAASPTQPAPLAAGRLNGSDFAVLHPLSLSPQALTEELMQRLRTVLHGQPGVAIVMSATGCPRDVAVAALMSSVDRALAEAELAGPFHCHIDGIDEAPVPGGEDAWRRALLDTLMSARLQLQPYPVRDARGALLHLECPLRLQLVEDGPMEPARRWLPMAQRTGLGSDVDMAAVALALTAITADHQPRGVNLSPNSLGDPNFLPRLRARVIAAGETARRLWLEVDESALQRHPEALDELCRQLRPLGVRIGLEHAGERLASIGRLLEAGLDYVKLASTWTGGLGGDETRRQWLRSSVGMLHGVGLQVLVEGVLEQDELPALWAAGVDGVTGPAVR